MTSAQVQDALTISATERGVLRLFQIDLAPEERAALADDGGGHALAERLTGMALPPEHVDFLDLADIAAIGLPAYLAEGYDVPAEALAPREDDLSALRGQALILLSPLVPSGEVRMAPDPRLRMVAMLPVPGAAPAMLTPPPHEEPVTVALDTTPPVQAERRPLRVVIVILLLALLLLAAITLGTGG